MSQPAFCFWFTGLSGSGKTTLANELAVYFRSIGHQCYVLDGDRIRQGLCRDLGYSAEDRRENIRRISEVARLFVEAGLTVIVAFISPYKKDRDFARSLFEQGQFIEIYLNTSIRDCEIRDPKGLYARARRGEILDFTGVSSPYEPPVNSELKIDTSKVTVSTAILEIKRYMGYL